jgi:hypothetical protein
MNERERSVFERMVKEVARHIDPETAKVTCVDRTPSDPHVIHPHIPEELRQHIGLAYFARSPDIDIWVNFDDLPQATRDALWKKHRNKLTLMARLFGHTSA